MKRFRFVCLSIMLVVIFGCYHHVEGRVGYKRFPPITGKVVDGTTGHPIEGALVVAQWTKEHGFGLTYHELCLITETLTDKEGVFSITKTPNDLFVEPPEMIIYKEGYIPWRNDMIFPGGSSKLAKQHEWNDKVTYKLDMFTYKYTYGQLYQYLDHGVIGLGYAPIFHKILNEISGRYIDEAEALKSKQPNSK